MRPPLVLLHAVLLCHARRHGAVVDEAPSSRELGGRPRPRPASNGFRRPPPRVVRGQDARKKEAARAKPADEEVVAPQNEYDRQRAADRALREADASAAADRELVVAVDEAARFRDGARYFSVLDTAAAPATFGAAAPPGELWLLARNGRDAHTVAGVFAQLWLGGTPSRLAGGGGGARPLKLLESDSVAHNLGVAWWAGPDGAAPPALVAAGGLARAMTPNATTTFDGIALARAPTRADALARAPWSARPPTFERAIGRFHPGCVENRALYDGCQFDGRVSLAPHRGRLWLCARARRELTLGDEAHASRISLSLFPLPPLPSLKVRALEHERARRRPLRAGRVDAVARRGAFRTL